MATIAPIQVTDDNFQDEIENHDGVAIVDFWATWCGPCQIIAPVIEQMASEYEGRVKVAKLDVDANQATSAKFGVRSIPTVLIFKGGEKVDAVVGAVPREMLIQAVEKHL